MNTWRHKLAFVQVKANLIARYLSKSTADGLLFVYREMGKSCPAPERSEPYVIADRELEKHIDAFLFDDDAAVIRAELKKQFGFSALSLTPRKILGRILKRGRILDEDEANIVEDALDRHGLLPVANAKRLAELLRKYHESSQRPS